MSDSDIHRAQQEQTPGKGGTAGLRGVCLWLRSVDSRMPLPLSVQMGSWEVLSTGPSRPHTPHTAGCHGGRLQLCKGPRGRLRLLHRPSQMQCQGVNAAQEEALSCRSGEGGTEIRSLRAQEVEKNGPPCLSTSLTLRWYLNSCISSLSFDWGQTL